MKNEKGSTLLQVLLIILIFSVLGISLLTNVIGENKRVHVTESHIQTRNLARDGLIYFEKSFAEYVEDCIEKNNADKEGWITFGEMKQFFTEQYPDESWVTIRDNEGEKIEVKVSHPDIVKTSTDGFEYSDEKAERSFITVHSKGNDGKTVTELVGYYQLDYSFNFDIPTAQFAQFEEGTKLVDFTSGGLLGLEVIGGLVGLDALDFIFWHGDSGYYKVPEDGILDIDLLGEVLEVNLLGLIPDLLLNLIKGLSFGALDLEIPRFTTMEKYPVVAVRDAKAVGLDVLKIGDFSLLSLNILQLPVEKNVNVLINGSYDNVKIPLVSEALDKILGFLLPNLIPLEGGYQDIDFKKLSVVGNVVIQQDKNDCTDRLFQKCKQNTRRFTFDQGLFATQSILVGGERIKYNLPKLDNAFGANENNLEFAGDMVAMKDFMIDSANVTFVAAKELADSTIYVHNHAVIRQSCIQSHSSLFHLFVKEKLSIHHHSDCPSYHGLFYAENGIELYIPSGETMIINGEVIGDITIIGGGTLILYPEPDNRVKFSNVSLSPQGRDFN